MINQITPVLMAYFIGSLSFGIIISYFFKLSDPRTTGSGNPGATNVMRTGNKVAALLTLLGDMLKATIVITIANHMNLSEIHLVVISIAVLLGHIFPIYLLFKGGKGVATYLGGLIGLSFFVGLTFSIIWLIVAKVMKVSSIAALTATVLSPIYFYFITTHDVRATMVIFLINLFIYFTHRENIKRIMNGEEGVIGS